MIRSLNTGVGGIRNFQTSLDVIANNLANLNTVGFKGGRTDFAEALTQTIKPSTPDDANTSGSSSIQMANGVSTNSVTTIFSQGAVNQTGKITDLAIAGEGYFIVKQYTNKGAVNKSDTGESTVPNSTEPDKANKSTPAGIQYATRAGDFRLDSNGYLVNNSGMRVQGYSDLILEPSSVGDIKFDRGDYMSSVGVIDGSSDLITLTTRKNHGLKTGNIVVLKSETELPTPSEPTTAKKLQAGTPYYVHAVSDNKLVFYDNLADATANNKINALHVSPPKEGVRVVKKLASYESNSISNINKENTIFTKSAHGFKDGDKVEFYVGHSVKINHPAGDGAVYELDSETGIGDFTENGIRVDAIVGGSVIIDNAGGYSAGDFTKTGIAVESLKKDLLKGDVIVFDDGAQFTLSENASANAVNIKGNLTGVIVDDQGGKTRVLTKGDVIYFSNGAQFTLSEDVLAADSNINYSTIKGRLEGEKVSQGDGATMSSRSAGSLVIDNDGVKTSVSANVDGDKSGAFTRSFFISLRGDKSFTLHTSQEDASLRVRPIKFENIEDSVVTKVASSTTAEIQNISVDGAGRVNVMLTDGTQYSRGQVLLKKFTNEQALSKEGSNLYSNLQNAGGDKNWGVAGSDGYGRVESGALELSNVDVAREFSKLITTQRAFQANSRMVSASDEILMELLRLKR